MGLRKRVHTRLHARSNGIHLPILKTLLQLLFSGPSRQEYQDFNRRGGIFQCSEQNVNMRAEKHVEKALCGIKGYMYEGSVVHCDLDKQGPFVLHKLSKTTLVRKP